MKEKFQSALGSFGTILYFVFSLIACVMPFVVLDFSFFWTLIAFALIYFFNFFGGIVMFGLYIWAFIIAIQGPQDIIAILFYICFVLYVVPTVLSIVSALFAKK